MRISALLLAGLAVGVSGFLAPTCPPRRTHSDVVMAATKPEGSRPKVAAKKPVAAAPATSSSGSPLDQLSSFFSSILSPAPSSASAKSKKTEFVVAITGASGMVGRALTKTLAESKVGGLPVKVIKLVRSGSPREGEVAWDPATGEVDVKGIEGADAVIHLAGENVASGSKESLPALLGAWTDKKKQAIMSSRKEGTAAVVNAISRMSRPPKVLVCASAVGYYGYDTKDTTLDETDGKGSGFLAEVVDVWEGEARKAKGGVRVVSARLGVVLSKEGGLLAKLAPLFTVGGGGIIGDGQQYLSWVTLDDAVRALVFLMESPSLSGPVNVVAPQPVSNAEFTSAFGKVLGRPTLVPFPGFAAQAIFGEMGNEMLLGGQRVVPSKLEQAGFVFTAPTIEQGIAQALGK